MKATQDAIPEFVKGIPSLGVPSLDPFVIEKLPITLTGLKVTFYKGKVTGFRSCIVDNVVLVSLCNFFYLLQSIISILTPVVKQ